MWYRANDLAISFRYNILFKIHGIIFRCKVNWGRNHLKVGDSKLKYLPSNLQKKKKKSISKAYSLCSVFKVLTLLLSIPPSQHKLHWIFIIDYEASSALACHRQCAVTWVMFLQKRWNTPSIFTFHWQWILFFTHYTIFWFISADEAFSYLLQ